MAKAGNACSRISLPAKIVSKLSRNWIFWGKNIEIHSFACSGSNSCAQIHVLHFGSKNQMRDYHLCNTALSHVTEEKDLGVVISEDMKAEKKVVRNVKKADKILGAHDKKDILLHEQRRAATTIKVFIRPHLEYICSASLVP